MKRLLTHLSCLTRLAMTLVLVLSAMGAGAQTYTVTLKAGEGTGSDVTISNADAANVATSQSAAKNGQFWQEGDAWWFKVPDCPSTFTSPDEEKMFMGWEDGFWKPGYVVKITADKILTAYWDIGEFGESCLDDNGNPYYVTYRVTSRLPNEVEIKGCGTNYKDCTLVIPATVEYNEVSYSVTSIGKDAFNGACWFTSVSFPASVRSIEEKAFNNCDDLVTVTFAEASQLASIVKETFNDCDNLATVTFAEGSQLASIEMMAFHNCRNLETVTLHSNPFIEGGAFPDETNVTMTLPANPANGAYWTTFYNYFDNFQADANTMVYKATVSGSELTLHEVEDGIVNRFTAVIMKSSGNPVMTRTTSESADTNSNDLKGQNKRKLRTNLIGTGQAVYVLGMVNSVMGFYEYTGEYMPANKAYVVAPAPSAGAPTRGLSFVEEEVTNIESVDSGELTVDNWYTLSGVKLEGEPTERGVYIHNGRKEVVR